MLASFDVKLDRLAVSAGRVDARYRKLNEAYRRLQRQVSDGKAVDRLAHHVAAELGIVNTERHDAAVRKDTKIQSIKLPKR